MLSGITEVAEAEGLALMLVPGMVAGERDPTGMAAAAIDGVIAYSIASDDPVLAHTRRRGIPIVVIDQPRIAGVPRVGIDDEGAAHTAATHLRDLGHRRFAVISFALDRETGPRTASLASWPRTPYDVTRLRLTGYARALRDDVALDGAPLIACPGNADRSGREAARLLLSRSPHPTALLCLSDALALGARAAAKELGLRVPEDISIVGFDDIPRAGTSIPPLTTIGQAHRDKGRTAATMLFSILRDEAFEPEVTLPARLIVRGSTAAPPEPPTRLVCIRAADRRH